LAVDAKGHVEVFTTAGVAPVPSAVLDHANWVKPAEQFIDRMPIIGTSQLLVTLPRPNDYLGFASRGLFAYDWQDVHRSDKLKTRCYELIACPAMPISVRDLMPDLERAARLVRFSTLSFDGTSSIAVEQLVPCETA
jgi:hypothetical protein